MFGVLCGGRPVQTNLVPLDATRYALVIPNASKIHHMAVFLLPGAVLPAGSAASVYAQLPGRDFALLGALTPEKQSAIFRFRTDAVAAAAGSNDVDAMTDDDGEAANDYEINIGISLEPAEQAAAQLEALRQAQAPRAQTKAIMPPTPTPAAAPTAPTDIAALANKIVAHAYNYMSSFIDTQGKVPISAFDNWWNKFKSKLAADPAFLNSVE